MAGELRMSVPGPRLSPLSTPAACPAADGPKWPLLEGPSHATDSWNVRRVRRRRRHHLAKGGLQESLETPVFTIV